MEENFMTFEEAEALCQNFIACIEEAAERLKVLSDGGFELRGHPRSDAHPSQYYVIKEEHLPVPKRIVGGQDVDDHGDIVRE